MAHLRCRKLFITFSLLLTTVVQADSVLKFEDVYSPEKPEGDDWMYLQVYLGKLDTDDDTTIKDPETGEKATSDFPSLPFGGVQAQVPFAHSWFEYGWETGANVGWKNDDFKFVTTNNRTVIAFKNEIFLLEMHAGLYAAFTPTSRFRIYAGAGPVLAYGYASSDDEDDDEPANLPSSNQGGTNIRVNFDDNESDITLGTYVRVGLEYFTRTGFSFGAGVRRTDYTLDFKQVAGKVDINDNFYFISLGQRFKIL